MRKILQSLGLFGLAGLVGCSREKANEYARENPHEEIERITISESQRLINLCNGYGTKEAESLGIPIPDPEGYRTGKLLILEDTNEARVPIPSNLDGCDYTTTPKRIPPSSGKYVSGKLITKEEFELLGKNQK